MSRCDGGALLPAPTDGRVAAVDAVAVDALVARLDRVRAAALALLDARLAARSHLGDWSGPHRLAHDARAVACERMLAEAAAGLGRELVRLRAARDGAADPRATLR